MIKTISNRILKFITSNMEIADNMVEVYQYGIEITISSILNILLVFIASLCMGNVISGIVFLLCFIPIRSFSGGFHATTYFRCNAIFLGTYVIVHISAIYLMPFFRSNMQLMEIILLLAFLPFLFFAPVKNIHKTLSEKVSKKCRILSMAIYVLIGFLAMCFCYFNILSGAIMIMTETAVSVMILIEIFMQRRGYHEV